MNKKWIQTVCYVLAAGVACLASASGISKSDGAVQALAKQEGEAAIEREVSQVLTLLLYFGYLTYDEDGSAASTHHRAKGRRHTGGGH